MGLVKCPDCGKEFSDRIDACPNCACPIDVAEKLSIDDKIIISNEAIKKKCDKNSKLSSSELFDFSVENIMPYIIEELGGDVEVIKGSKENGEPDFFLNTSNEKIGLNFVISIAPCKSNSGYNKELAERLYDKGIKFAVAQVSIGASDSYKFDRRILEKNDSYYFDYEKLYFYDVEKFYGVKLMLGKNTNYEQIYERKAEANEWLKVKKNIDNYRAEFLNDSLVHEILVKYGVNEKFYEKFFHIIGSSIDYKLSYKDLVINFLNCVDIVDGVVLSDDKEVKRRDIIKKCIDYYDNNTLVNLDNYDIYWLSFFVYYYIANNKNKSPILSLEEYKKIKIDLYENDHSLFGFKKSYRELENNDVLENKRNIFKMNNYIIEYFDIYNEYIEIDKAIKNENILSVAIKYSNDLMNYLKKIKIMNSFVSHYIDEDQIGKYKEQFYYFKDVLYNFENLLYCEAPRMKKYYIKANGEKFKYGFFEQRKDKKKIDALKPLFYESAKKLEKVYIKKNISKELNDVLEVGINITEKLVDDYLDNENIKSKLEIEIKKLKSFQTTPESEEIISNLLKSSNDMLKIINDEISDEEYTIFEKNTLLNMNKINEKIYDLYI